MKFILSLIFNAGTSGWSTSILSTFETNARLKLWTVLHCKCHPCIIPSLWNRMRPSFVSRFRTLSSPEIISTLCQWLLSVSPECIGKTILECLVSQSGRKYGCQCLLNNFTLRCSRNRLGRIRSASSCLNILNNVSLFLQTAVSLVRIRWHCKEYKIGKLFSKLIHQDVLPWSDKTCKRTVSDKFWYSRNAVWTCLCSVKSQVYYSIFVLSFLAISPKNAVKSYSRLEWPVQRGEPAYAILLVQMLGLFAISKSVSNANHCNRYFNILSKCIYSSHQKNTKCSKMKKKILNIEVFKKYQLLPKICQLDALPKIGKKS